MKRLELKHPLAIRWFHWVNFPVLAIMVWSGTLIYWANGVYRIGWGDTTILKFYPASFYELFKIDHRLAEGMSWHFMFMWLFALNGLAYVIYLVVSGEWRYVVPRGGALKQALQVTLYDLHLRRTHPPMRKYNAAQQIAYTAVVLMGVGSLLTGLAIYKPTQLNWLTSALGGYAAARIEHFILTIGFVLFFLLHVGQVIRTGWNNFQAMITGVELVPVTHAPEPAATTAAPAAVLTATDTTAVQPHTAAPEESNTLPAPPQADISQPEATDNPEGGHGHE